MDFISIKFVLFIFTALAIIRTTALYGGKNIAVLALNLFFIGSFAQGARYLAPVIIFLSAGFFLVKLVSVYKNKVSVSGSLAIIIMMFVYLKRYSIISSISVFTKTYVTVGLSYMLFRTIELIVDTHQCAKSEKIGIIQFLNYNCFFLSYVAGPIQRYESFKAEFDRMGRVSVDNATVISALSRIVNGYLKVGCFAMLFMGFHHKSCRLYFHHAEPFSFFNSSFLVAIMALTFAIYLYLNFSGYMDIVIGIGRLAGFKLPENFNGPFASKNFMEFWSRWHITLSSWFRTFVFNPAMKIMAERWPDKTLAAYYSAAAFFITFFLMGIWHGTTLPFVIFGLFLGAGVTVNRLFDFLLRKIHMAKYGNNPVFGYFSRGLTISYFSVSLLCVKLKSSRLIEILQGNNLIGMIGVLVFGAVTVSLCAFLLDVISRMWRQFDRITRDVKGEWLLSRLWLSFKILVLIALFLVRMYPVYDFVYKGF